MVGLEISMLGDDTILGLMYLHMKLRIPSLGSTTRGLVYAVLCRDEIPTNHPLSPTTPKYAQLLIQVLPQVSASSNGSTRRSVWTIQRGARPVVVPGL